MKNENKEIKYTEPEDYFPKEIRERFLGVKEQPDQEGCKKITLTADQMKSIARYELTFAGMVREDEPGVPDVNCPEVYSFTLDDLYLALKAIREANPTVKDVRDYWFSGSSGTVL